MILLDFKDSRPIYEQVEEKLKELMLLEVLEEDSQLPSVRSLAMELAVNPNTIQRAYSELERDGYIYSVKGRGNFVGSLARLKKKKQTELQSHIQKIVETAKNLGVSEDEFIKLVKEMYSETEAHAPADDSEKEGTDND